MLLRERSYSICSVNIIYLAAVFLDIAVKEVLERADREVRGLVVEVEFFLAAAVRAYRVLVRYFRLGNSESLDRKSVV